MRSISNDAVEMIQSFEGLELAAYRCSAGVLTIGYGHTGPDVSEGMRITKEEADSLFDKDIGFFEKEVDLLTRELDLPQCQFDALVSFAYNLGVSSLQRSTLFKHVRNRDSAAAAKEFMKWVNAKGKPVKGLFARRGAETAMFEGRDWADGREEGVEMFMAR